VSALLGVVPRIVIEQRGIVWADARGLPARRVAMTLLEELRRRGFAGVRAGIARTAIVAEVAAIHPPPSSAFAAAAASAEPALTLVAARQDRRFLAPYALSVLAPEPHVMAMLDDVGIATCGDLARLDREAVEVRLGSDGLALWRLARADDPRRIFGRSPRTLPTASVEWVDYTLRGGESLMFVVNRLVQTVCAELHAWGEGARVMTLDFALANREHHVHTLRTTRATASRATWMRRIRLELEQIRLPDAVAGVTLHVEALAGTEAPQGDLFDAGFQTAGGVEDALSVIEDDQVADVIELMPSAHPLPERRVLWRARPSAASYDALMHDALSHDTLAPGSAEGGSLWTGTSVPPHLALQLLPEPRPITVTTERRRGSDVPVRYRDTSGDVALLIVAGPDRIASIDPGAPYAREYFHGVTSDGVLVLLFHDLRKQSWYLHGWWD
jgi:protein ImuB